MDIAGRHGSRKNLAALPKRSPLSRIEGGKNWKGNSMILLNQPIMFKDPNAEIIFGAAYRAEIELKEEDGKRVSWIQCLKEGEFKHPLFGDLSISRNEFKDYIRNFRSKVHKVDLAVNINHKKDEAAGWIVDLEERDGGRTFWAKVEWTEFGVKKIESMEFKYVSSEFYQFYTDNETGKTIKNVFVGAALTNNPFIKGMEKVQLTEPPLDQKPRKEFNTMNKHELIAKLIEFGVDVNKLESQAAELLGARTELSEAKENLRKSEAKLSEVTKERDELKTSNEAMKKQDSERKFNDLVEKGMKEGKLTKAMAEGSFKELHEKMGHDWAEKHLSEMPKVVDLSDSIGSGGDGKGGDDKKDAETKLSEAATKIMNKWNSERGPNDKELSFTEALDRAMKANPELAKEYEAALTEQVEETRG